MAIAYCVNFAISCAVECILALLCQSIPTGLSKYESVIPICFAFSFIIVANASLEPATSSAITSAASPAETIKSIYKSCSIVYVEPALNPTIDDSTSTLSKAACFTSISLSKLQFSIATTAVNNLVVLAG